MILKRSGAKHRGATAAAPAGATATHRGATAPVVASAAVAAAGGSDTAPAVARDQGAVGVEQVVPVEDEEVLVKDGTVRLPGVLTIPSGAVGVAVFAHGSGSSRSSPRNVMVAEQLNAAGG